MNIQYRLATIEDIPDLCEIRKIQLIHEGIEPVVNIDQYLHEFFEEHFKSNQLYQILACVDGKIIATGAICFYFYPPSYTNPTGRIAYITNMYTDPMYRKQGIATNILGMLKEETKRRKVQIMRLGASQMGRPIYEKIGFVQDTRWLSQKIDIQED